MIYLVSGWAFTGTSMMMEALIAGGMNAAYSEDKDDITNAFYEKRSGVNPKQSYYELKKADQQKKGFPADYDGKLIKFLYGGIPKLNAGLAYRAIYMRRPQAHVTSDLAGVYGTKGVGNASRPNWVKKQEDAVKWMRDRPSQFLTVDEIWYELMRDEPEKVFAKLAADGWPIDPVKAAKIPVREKEPA